MNATVALSVIGVVLLGTIALGLWGVRRVRMDPHQLIVGGRSFGTLLLWVLLAGEIYTSFTFLGAAGWAYGKGAPAFYILCYGPLAYIFSYFLGPLIWRVSREHNLLTGPDFFVAQYGSRALGVGVALVSVVFIVPYATLQLSGIETLLRIAGYDSLNATVAVGLAFALIIFFVFSCGLRGVAWASVVKDMLVLVAVVFAGIWLPVHFFGSPAAVIDRVLAAHPHWMTLEHRPLRAAARPGLSRRSCSTGWAFTCGRSRWPRCIRRRTRNPSAATRFFCLSTNCCCCWCISPVGRRCC